mmetsp:Transcript_9392/g.15076  ORF Transcript_9392/g.15076 Transcript_9392/m.15076 type:complete len:202 (-) Transcript_9392:440-1045(-)|eukprot:CAMPEP_0178763174 /NCGR_PEP_ID=MMETSP0744-20121128/16990_1 /TAXON_ID=913974 /ORGANISM="Nitzschia punctata, Strain CCMP561" /LENGTH=201 /DNA_ID=CAMNT_0020418011 /DNA_START=67 /DNA_END=672 /DNA_ORIENTATION=-
MILPHHHLPGGLRHGEDDNDEDEEPLRNNSEGNRNERKPDACERLMNIAVNDRWMVCYCLVLTLLEWWTFPQLGRDLFRYLPIHPTDDYPPVIMYPYMAFLGFAIGAGGVFVGFVVTVFPFLSVVRTILLCKDSDGFVQREMVQRQEQQSPTIRFVRFIGLLPLQFLVLWTSWKQDGLLFTLLKEFTKPGFYEDFLRSVAI